MSAAYPEVIAEMEKRSLTRREVANGLGISTRTLYSKLFGKTDFTLSEADAIHAKFFPDVAKDKLFTRTEPGYH